MATYTSQLPLTPLALRPSANLRLMEELSDRSAQGRACGNLGNTHYLLGNFAQAISYHSEVLLGREATRIPLGCRQGAARVPQRCRKGAIRVPFRCH